MALPSAVPTAAYAAEASATVQTGTSIDAVPTRYAGDTVTISGATDAADVIIKVLNPDGTVLFFDIAASSGGRFQDSFKLSSSAPAGTYKIAAGQGTNVASATFSVASSSGGGGNGVGNGGGGSTTTSGGGGNTGTGPTDNAAVQIHFALSDLPAPVGGIVTLDTAGQLGGGGGGNVEVLLPAAISQSLGGGSLRILLPNGSVTLPKDVLSALGTLAGSDGKAQISLHVQALSADELKAALAKSGQSGAGLVPQGSLYAFTLGIAKEDGTLSKLSAFPAPVALQFKLQGDTDARLAGIYYFSDGGAVEYIGGVLRDRTLSAEVSHFSNYGVFVYAKNYTDVPATYWAAGVIQEMTAKHVVQGISASQFGPKQNVTRAEFAAMLVRALGLKATGDAPFADVPADSWYAETTAAAYANGIVNGTTGGKFEPGKPIAREEMAAMIARIYAKQHGSEAPGGSASDLAVFKDANAISAWAKPEVQSAVHAGLMQGSGGLFAPRGSATRAEATQVLANLLLEQ